MNEWMNGMDRWMNEMDEMNGMYEWDGQVGWMDGGMDGQMDGWKHDMQDGTAALTLLSCFIIIMHHDHDDDFCQERSGH